MKTIPSLLLTVILFFPAHFISAQPLRGEWILGSGGDNNVNNLISVYADGTVCQAGLFRGPTYNIGSYHLTSQGKESFYIMRFNTDGNNNGMWLQQLVTHSGASMTLLDVFLDQKENAHILGTFDGDSIYLETTVYGSASLVDTSHMGNPKLFYLILAHDGDIVSLTAPIPFENEVAGYYEWYHVAWNEAGNMAVSGFFTGDSLYAGDILLKNPYSTDSYFILYYDDQGDPLWGVNNGVANSMGEDYLTFYAGDLDISPDGSVTAAGAYEGNVNPVFGTDEMPVPSQEKNFFLVHYASSGGFLWSSAGVQTYATAEIYQLQHTSSGEIYLAGNFFEGIISFDPVTLDHPDNGPAPFLFKFDASGTALWARAFPITNGMKGWQEKGDVQDSPTFSRMFLDDQEDVCITGWYSRDVVTFPGGGDTIVRTPDHEYDQYLVKYGPDGDFQWVQQITSDVQKTPPAMVDAEDNIYLAGTYRDTLFIKNDTIPMPGFNNAVYILGFEDQGGLVYQNSIVQAVDDTFTVDVDMILPAKKRSIYLSGAFRGEIGIDSRHIPAVYTDNIYLAKLSPNTSLAGDVVLQSEDTVTHGFVYLYQVLPTDDPVLVEVAGIYDKGRYVFSNIDYGNYFLLVRPDTNDYPAALDTWYRAGATMEEADTLYFTTDTLLVPTIVVREPRDTFDILGGMVTDTAGNAVFPGYVLLYRLNATGAAQVTDSVLLDDAGNYLFHNIVSGNYLIYVFADTSVWTGAIGTYYGDMAFWEMADTVKVTADDITDRNITILQIERQLDGTGRMEGDIFREEPTKSISSVTGEPVKKIKVILIEVKKGTGDIVAWVYTDDEGHYVFRNIPDGTYRIIVDIPGLPQDSTYTVTISVDNNVISGLDFQVTKEEVKVAKATGIALSPADLLHMSVWPNPTTGQITVVLPEEGAGTVTLYDPRGRVAGKYLIPGGRKTLVMDLSGLPAGIYYLQVTSRRKTGVSKVIIQR